MNDKMFCQNDLAIRDRFINCQKNGAVETTMVIKGGRIENKV